MAPGTGHQAGATQSPQLLRVYSQGPKEESREGRSPRAMLSRDRKRLGLNNSLFLQRRVTSKSEWWFIRDGGFLRRGDNRKD